MIFLSFLTVDRVACVNRFYPIGPNSGGFNDNKL
jgi:hypothetical protein